MHRFHVPFHGRKWFFVPLLFDTVSRLFYPVCRNLTICSMFLFIIITIITITAIIIILFLIFIILSLSLSLSFAALFANKDY